MNSDYSKKEEVLYSLIDRITEIRNYAQSIEKQYENRIAEIHPYYVNSARNLIHYLAIRTFDLNKIQNQLTTLGLSSLDHSEGYTLVNLNNILHLLHLMCGQTNLQGTHSFSMDYPKSQIRLKQHADALFGAEASSRLTRIMVTMPTEAATDKKLIKKLLNAGMECARINCSHDSYDIWKKMIKNVKKLSRKKGMPCKIYMDLAGPKLRTGPIEEVKVATKKKGKSKKKSKKSKGKSYKKKNGFVLHIGDTLKVFKDKRIGKGEQQIVEDELIEPAFISTTLPDIFKDVKAGESIWFDDGKVGGDIIQIHEDHFEVSITDASEKGSWLLAGKGINLPDTDLTLPSLTEDDLKNLPLILANADMVGYSFVRKPKDVTVLQKLLKEYGREDIGIILKIETWDAFHNLPEILLTAMKSPKVGVMIARGDLAIEVGWQRISELQEEILWLCEAAHIPTIWATQILENLAKKGLATRSEITDAAMAGRAECAMLNKGPYIVKAVSTLQEIMGRMKAHQRKKMDMLRPLAVAIDFIDGGSMKVKQDNSLLVEI